MCANYFDPLLLSSLLDAYVAACLLLCLGYGWLLRKVLIAWRSIPVWTGVASPQPQVSISVVIAARNEEAHIETCVRAVLEGTYPRTLREVIVVDDHSEDATACVVADLVNAFPNEVRLLRLSDADSPSLLGKKKAIAHGIAHARGRLIVTTDADCIVPPDWLRELAAAYERHRPSAIVAPISLRTRSSCWENFQALDSAATMGIAGAALTRGWFALGSGANLCYPKAVFLRLNGFAGNEHYASGDDMFLLSKLPLKEILFLKSTKAVVCTLPCPTLSAFLQQRLRWGTKNAHWPNNRLRAVLGLMWMFSFTWVINVLVAFEHPLLGIVAFVQLGVRAWADRALLSEMCTFFCQRNALRSFWPALIMHFIYLAVVGTATLFFRRYTWKGRRWK
ncbi:MAG: glycosyltransferase [Saprospiraceae bacterium]|nr:glycosyltransferase [Saprospiraceae bacterium]MDW8482715.1 glycosyltransferase [Saprospiraceae bacterium]